MLINEWVFHILHGILFITYPSNAPAFLNNSIIVLSHVQFACKSNLTFLCRTALLSVSFYSLFLQLGSAIQAYNLLLSYRIALLFHTILLFANLLILQLHSTYKLYTLITHATYSPKYNSWYSLPRHFLTQPASSLLCLQCFTAPNISSTPVLHPQKLIFLKLSQNKHAISPKALGYVSSSPRCSSQEHTDQKAFYGLLSCTCVCITKIFHTEHISLHGTDFQLNNL